MAELILQESGACFLKACVGASIPEKIPCPTENEGDSVCQSAQESLATAFSKTINQSSESYQDQLIDYFRSFTGSTEKISCKVLDAVPFFNRYQLKESPADLAVMAPLLQCAIESIRQNNLTEADTWLRLINENIAKPYAFYATNLLTLNSPYEEREATADEKEILETQINVIVAIHGEAISELANAKVRADQQTSEKREYFSKLYDRIDSLLTPTALQGQYAIDKKKGEMEALARWMGWGDTLAKDFLEKPTQDLLDYLPSCHVSAWEDDYVEMVLETGSPVVFKTLVAAMKHCLVVEADENNRERLVEWLEEYTEDVVRKEDQGYYQHHIGFGSHFGFAKYRATSEDADFYLNSIGFGGGAGLSFYYSYFFNNKWALQVGVDWSALRIEDPLLFLPQTKKIEWLVGFDTITDLSLTPGGAYFPLPWLKIQATVRAGFLIPHEVEESANVSMTNFYLGLGGAIFYHFNPDRNHPRVSFDIGAQAYGTFFSAPGRPNGGSLSPDYMVLPLVISADIALD